MSGVGAVVGTIALASIVVISIIGFNKANNIQADYNSKMKDVVDQINTAQYYEYQFDKKHKARTEDLEKNVQDVRKTYVTKDDAAKTVSTSSVEVSGNLKSDKDFTETNKIRFSKQWTGFPDKVTDQSEISNDTKDYKKLMVVGNKSGGTGERRVGVWDRLDVHGNMGVDQWLSAQNTQGRHHVFAGNWDAWMRNDGWVESQNTHGRDHVLAGNWDAWMRNDGWVESRNTHGRDHVLAGNWAAWMRNDGWVESQNTHGRDHVVAGDWASYMRNDGLIKGNHYQSDGWNDWNWYEVRKPDGNLYFGGDNGNRGIWSDGNRPFTVYTQGQPRLIVDANGQRVKAKTNTFTVGNNVDDNRGITLYSHEGDGAALGNNNHQGGLASWYGVGFKNKIDGGVRFMHDTRTGTTASSGTVWSGDWVDGRNVQGRDHVRAGDWAAWMRNDGNGQFRDTLYVGDRLHPDTLRSWGWRFAAHNGNGTHTYISHKDGLGIHLNTQNTDPNKWALELHNGAWSMFRVHNNGKVNPNQWTDFDYVKVGQGPAWDPGNDLGATGTYLHKDGQIRSRNTTENDWVHKLYGREHQNIHMINNQGYGMHINTRNNDPNKYTLETYNRDYRTSWLGNTGDLWVSGNMNTNSLQQRSDKRLKTDIKDIPKEDNDNFSKLQSKQFIMKGHDTPTYGFVAQDVEKIYPNIVKEGIDGMKTINYNAVTPLLVNQVQDIRKNIPSNKQICIDDVCVTKEDLLKIKKISN